MIAKLYFPALKKLLNSLAEPSTCSQCHRLRLIGSNSGGLVSVPQAAKLDARVAVVESHKLGVTCMNVERVPKKVM